MSIVVGLESSSSADVDHGSNYTAMVYTDRIVELGAVPSTGTVGDSYDNALAEAINNLYKRNTMNSPDLWCQPNDERIGRNKSQANSAPVRRQPIRGALLG